MPRGDGTGPGLLGQGRGAGRGFGRGFGRGLGRGTSAGPGGYCVCPNCGEKVNHQVGQPCNKQQCPKCGTTMTRA